MAFALPRPPLSARLLAEGALWLNLGFCVLAWGGAVPWALYPMVALSAVGLVATAGDTYRRGRRLWVPAIAGLLLGGAAVCLLQLVPLPLALLKALSPPAADLRDFALLPLGLARARPVSLDPPSTWRELAKHLSYFGAFVTAANLCDSRAVARRLFAGVALAGGALALVGFGHLLLDVHALWGRFPYISAQPPLVTPLGNPNHLAGVLTLSSTVALGLVLSAGHRQQMAAWGIVYVLSGAAVLLSLSRGGIVFFAAGQVAVLLWAVWLKGRSQRPDRPASLIAPLVAAALLVTTALVGGYLAYDPVVNELETANTFEKIQHSKVELWPMMLEAAAKVWPLGMGRGAFEVGLTRYQTKYPGTTFTHAENVLLQLFSELGVLATLALVSLGLVALAQRVARVRSLMDAAALVALVALFCHELFDFSWELSGCALLTTVVAAALWPRYSREDDGFAARLPKGPGAVLVVGAVLLSAAGALWGRERPEDAEAKLLAVARTGGPAELRRASLPLIDRHPADYRLYALVGAEESTSSPLDGLAFLNRALFLKPLDAPSHRAAAWALRRLRRREQAILEYRLAAESGAPEDAMWREALPIVKSEEDLRRLWGDHLPWAPGLAESLMARGRWGEAAALLAWAQEEAGPEGHPELWESAAQLALRRERPQDALAALDEAGRRGAPGTTVAIFKAEAHNRLGQKDEAFATLEAALAKAPEDPALGFALAQSYLASSRPVRAREVLQRIGPYAQDRVRYFALEGETFFMEGKLNRALESYQSASHLAPERADLRYALARTYEALHRPGDAVDAVRAGLQAEGPQGKPAADAWIGRLEAEETKLKEQAP